MAANLSLANDLTHLKTGKDSWLISGCGANFITGCLSPVQDELD